MGAYALLVGISEFTDERLAKLNAPKGDVEAFAEVLKDPARGGFANVAICIDQDLQTIRDELMALLEGRNPDDLVLLYYSGHGIIAKGQRLFLATGKSSFDRPQARSLAAVEMRDMLEQSRAGKQIVILDCCHSGAFVEGAKGATQALTDDTFGSDSAEGQYVLTATDAQQFAYDATGALREGASGPALSRFTGWLVDAIGKGEAAPDKERITLDAVFDYLSRRARVEAAGMTPKRFVKRSSGEMVIARNPAAKPRRLPDELIAQLDSKDWEVRRDAVQELAKVAEQPRHKALAEKAVADRISGERDVDVREAMLALLRELDNPHAPEPKPAPSPIEPIGGGMRDPPPVYEPPPEPIWRRVKWAVPAAAAAAIVLVAIVGTYAFVSMRSDDEGKAADTGQVPTAGVSPVTAVIRSRINDLTLEEALRVARAMEPNLATRRIAVRDVVSGVDPTGLRLSEGPVARFVLELWLLNDDRDAASTKQWIDILASVDADRRKLAADRAAGEIQAAKQREAEAAKQREAEAAKQRDAEAARQQAEATKQSEVNAARQGAAEAARARATAVREREAQARRTPGTEFKDCAECPAVITVPAGGMTMGSATSEAGRDRDESPQHRVTIPDAFAVGKYEVTFAEWDACAADGGCNGYRPSDEGWGRGTRPVIHVSWNDAQAYIAWLRQKTRQPYRLLSEAEWEYAARAATVSAYYWGPRASTANAKYNSRDGTAPVGTYAPNSFGLYDMSGNVSEWAADCMNASYGGALSNGRPWLEGDCDLRALRGGAWNSGPNNLRSANRDFDAAGFRVFRNGFRVGRQL